METVLYTLAYLFIGFVVTVIAELIDSSRGDKEMKYILGILIWPFILFIFLVVGLGKAAKYSVEGTVNFIKEIEFNKDEY